MSDTITRRECPECGWLPSPYDDVLRLCPQHKLPTIERTYVAVDALVSDEAFEAGARDLRLYNAINADEALRESKTAIRAAVEAARR